MEDLRYSAVRRVGTAAAGHLPTFNNVKSTMYRSRRKNEPPLPQTRIGINLSENQRHTRPDANGHRRSFFIGAAAVPRNAFLIFATEDAIDKYVSVFLPLTSQLTLPGIRLKEHLLQSTFESVEITVILHHSAWRVAPGGPWTARSGSCPLSTINSTRSTISTAQSSFPPSTFS